MAPDKPELSETQVERATNLLDIRRIIGSLLGIYGLLLLGAGLLAATRTRTRPRA